MAPGPIPVLRLSRAGRTASSGRDTPKRAKVRRPRRRQAYERNLGVMSCAAWVLTCPLLIVNQQGARPIGEPVITLAPVGELVPVVADLTVAVAEDRTVRPDLRHA